MLIKHIILISLLLLSCTSTNKKSVQENKSVQEENILKYAEHLKIYESKNQVRIEILHPDKKNVNFKAILAKTKPNLLPKDYVFIQIPINNIAILSATQIGMLSKLNEIERISAVSDQKYIYNKHILLRIDQGKTSSLGNESSIPAESIISSGSKYLFYSDFGQEFPHSKQLEKIGINVIPNPDWRETHPLGKAEWIKLLGYLTDKSKEADSIFKNIETEYLKFSQIAQKQTKKSSLISGNMLGDIWWAPAGESYNSKIFSDAGGSYVYSKMKGTGSIERTVEQIIDENATTKFWFNPGFSSKKEILKNCPKLKYLPLINSQNIYCYSHNMNYYWEMSAIEPHLVLKDLIRIFHPDLLPQGKLYFYKTVN